MKLLVITMTLVPTLCFSPRDGDTSGEIAGDNDDAGADFVFQSP